MSFFVIDDQAPVHPKHQALVDRGLEGDALALAAGYLWTLMGAHLRASYADGVVDRRDLYRVMPGPLVDRLPAYLVEAGLWHDHEHCCERCERPEPGRWCYHDWRQWSQRTGDEDRLRRALQTERKDQWLHDAMWERDALPQAPGAHQRALCAYCQRVVYRDTRKGDLAPEMDHVFGRAMGLDGVVVSCRACNRSKGNRSASRAGMSLHPTPAHAAALARRAEHGSRPGEGPADLLELAWATPERTEGVVDVDRGSRPGEGPADSVVPVDPALWGECDPGDVGWCEPSLPEGGGSSVPASSAGRGSRPGEGLAEPASTGGGSSVPICPQEGPQEPRSGLSPQEPRSGLSPQPVGIGATAPAAASQAPLQAPSSAPDGVAPASASRARTRTGARTGPRAGARAGARSPARQGRAGQGREQERQGQGRAPARPTESVGRDGAEGEGLRSGRRRRRRGRRRRGPVCSVHGDRVPCRLCDEEGECW